MEDVIQKADDLAQALRAHDRYRKMRVAEQALENDEEAQNLTGEFQAAQALIAEKEKSGKPIEVEDKRRISELQQKVGASENLQAFLRAQADFYEMMNRVNQSIQTVLGGGDDEA